MKNLYLIFLLLSTISSTSQTTFSTAFTGELPTQIQLVNDDLYVGTFYGYKVYRININNPNNAELVYDFTSTPIWKMGYDAINNRLYSYNFSNISSFDLTQSLPISPTNVINVNNSQGFDISNGIIYISIGSDIYTYDINVGAGSYQLVYSDMDGDIRNPRVYNNELYFAEGSSSNNLYKIDLASSNPQKVLISSNLGLVQASLIVNNYLYLGVESTNKLLRIDLSEVNLPITPVVLADNLNGAILGLANKGTTIYASDGTSQNINTFQDLALSINEVYKNAISVYPNPTNDFLKIKGDQLSDLSFKIYSLGGVLIDEGIYNNSKIDVSNIAQGLYFIHLIQNDNTLTQRFLKN